MLVVFDFLHKIPQSTGEFVLVNVLVLWDVSEGAVLPRAAGRPPEKALLLVRAEAWKGVRGGRSGHTESIVEFIGISHSEWSALYHHSINTLDGSVTVFFSGVVHKGTLLFQQHLDAVDCAGSAEELVKC